MEIFWIINIIIVILLMTSLGLLLIRKKADYKRSLDMTFLRIMIPKKESDLDEKKETIHDFK